MGRTGKGWKNWMGESGGSWRRIASFLPGRVPLRRAAGVVVAAGVALVAGAGVAGCFRLDPFVYWPEKTDAYTLDPALIPVEDREEVSLWAADGTRLAGVMVRAPDPNGMTVLYCHGTAAHIDHYYERVAVLYRMGFDVFVFDYRGYGRSEGEPDEAGLYLDGEAAFEYLTRVRRVPTDRLLIYGYSLGGGVATEIALRHPPAALVLESTFTSVQEAVASSTYLDVPSHFALDAAFDNVGKVRRMGPFPKVVLHGTEDQTFPIAFGERLWAEATEPKSFHAFPGAGHGEVFSSDPGRYRRILCCRAWTEGGGSGAGRDRCLGVPPAEVPGACEEAG